jgi:hypothetical protein
MANYDYCLLKAPTFFVPSTNGQAVVLKTSSKDHETKHPVHEVMFFYVTLSVNFHILLLDILLSKKCDGKCVVIMF